MTTLKEMLNVSLLKDPLFTLIGIREGGGISICVCVYQSWAFELVSRHRVFRIKSKSDVDHSPPTIHSAWP